MNVTLQTWLVPILLWVAALAFAGVAIAREPGLIRREFVIDRLLRYLFLFPLGVMSVWAFVGHVFFPERSARRSAGRRARSNTRSASPISGSALPVFTRPSPVLGRAWPFLSLPCAF